MLAEQGYGAHANSLVLSSWRDRCVPFQQIKPKKADMCKLDQLILSSIFLPTIMFCFLCGLQKCE